jgi:hypothetical protein
MISAEDRAPMGRCDADTDCRHAPCFQVQLEAARPRQANACAYHVAEVIEALRAWAGERGVVGGQLTILAIEPAAGGRQPGGSAAPHGAGLHGFPFTTIPLASAQRIEPGAAPHQHQHQHQHQEHDSAREG